MATNTVKVRDLDRAGQQALLLLGLGIGSGMTEDEADDIMESFAAEQERGAPPEPDEREWLKQVYSAANKRLRRHGWPEGRISERRWAAGFWVAAKLSERLRLDDFLAVAATMEPARLRMVDDGVFKP